MKALSKRKKVAYFCSATFAVLFFAVMMLLTSTQNPIEQVDEAITPLSASSTSGIMLAMGAILALWSLSVKIRCSDRFVRRCLGLIAFLFSLWMILVVLKYACSDEYWRFITFCWYYFYVPIIAAPTLCLICAIHIASLPSHISKTIICAITAIALILIVLVFTNSFHYSIFTFDYADPNWQSHYTYEFGYKIIVAWQIALIMAFFVVITYVSRTRLLKAAVIIGIFIFVLLIYALLYRLRIEYVFKSNFALNYVIMITFLMELCLDTGIFPSFIHYRRLFEELPFDINIFSNSMKIAHQTKGATPPNNEAIKLIKQLKENDSFQGIASDVDGDKQYLAWNIQGGTALLTEDISELNESSRRIRAEQEALERRNELLRTEIELKSEAACIDNELKLIEEIRLSLNKTFKTMHKILNELSQSSAEANEQDTKKKLQRLRFLVAYSKRKSSLLLMEKDGEDYDKERLLLVANELAADARASGIECAAFVDRPAAITHGALSAFYDSLYNIIMLCFDLKQPTLLISSTRRNEEYLNIDVILEYENQLLLEVDTVDEQLLSPLKVYGLDYRFKSGINGFTLSFIVPISRPKGVSAS